MANYPTSVSTDANLYIAVNNTRTQLNGAINNSVTTITVDSTTGFPASGLISIDTEVIAYTSVNATQFLGCIRGFDGTTAASHIDDSFVSLRVVAAHHNNLKDEIIAVEGNLNTRIGNSTTQLLTPDGSLAAPSHSFASDPDTGLQRNSANVMNLVTNGAAGLQVSSTDTYIMRGQLYNQSGTASAPSISFDTDPDTGVFRSASNSVGIAAGATQVGTFSSSGVTIKGTTTNDNAAVGFVGEYVSSSVDTLQNSPADAVWGDITSISLTAGDWDVYGAVNHTRNTATWTQARAGFGTTSGNNAPNLGLGAAAGVQDSVVDFASSATTPNNVWANLLPARVSITSTTTVYLKIRQRYSAGQAQYVGSMFARRIR